MANTLKTQTYKHPHLEMLGNRPLIVINEHSSEYYFHGVVIGPANMSYEDALQLLDEGFNSARKSEDWNYDDVFEAWRTRGFETLACGDWNEGNV